MTAIERFTNAAALLFARLGGAMIVIIAVIVSVDVVTRNLYGQTVLNSFEFSIYLFAIAISFGLSYTALCGAHIRVDVLSAKFPQPLRRALDLFAFLSLAALGAFLTYFAGHLAFSSLQRGVTSSSAIAFPLGLPQMLWATGFAIFALTCMLLTIRHASYLLQGRGKDADRLGHFSQEEEVAEAIEDAKRREQ